MNKLALALAVLVATPSASLCQSVTPMRGTSRSVVETFAVRIVVGNPYPQQQTFAVKVYDDKFFPIAAEVSLPFLKLPAQGSRTVLVMVPFDGMQNRKVRICAEGLFGTAESSKLRTQVCGKFLATHIGS